MKNKYLIILTGVLAILYMIISFIVFDNMHWESENAIESFVASPAITAGAFGFGSGNIAFWTIVIIETLIIWGIFFLLSKVFSMVLKKKR